MFGIQMILSFELCSRSFVLFITEFPILLFSNRFWDLLRDQLEVRPVRQLPLVTTFNRGYGDATFSKGEVISTNFRSTLG